MWIIWPSSTPRWRIELTDSLVQRHSATTLTSSIDFHPETEASNRVKWHKQMFIHANKSNNSYLRTNQAQGGSRSLRILRYWYRHLRLLHCFWSIQIEIRFHFPWTNHIDMHEAFLLLIQALHPTGKQKFIVRWKTFTSIWHMIANPLGLVYLSNFIGIPGASNNYQSAFNQFLANSRTNANTCSCDKSYPSNPSIHLLHNTYVFH